MNKLLDRIVFLCGCIYLAIDVSHFFVYRMGSRWGPSGVIWEAAYEANEISLLRWVLLVLLLLVIRYGAFKNKAFYYLLFSLCTAAMFFSGRAYSPIRGGFVYDFALMELIAFVCFFSVLFWMVKGVVKFSISQYSFLFTFVFLFFLLVKWFRI